MASKPHSGASPFVTAIIHVFYGVMSSTKTKSDRTKSDRTNFLNCILNAKLHGIQPETSIAHVKHRNRKVAINYAVELTMTSYVRNN